MYWPVHISMSSGAPQMQAFLMVQLNYERNKWDKAK